MTEQQAKRTIPENARDVRSDESERSGVTSSATVGAAEEDHIYGLASVLYHSLQAVTAAHKYAADAQRAGVDELREFFEECRDEADARAKQAKALLVAYSDEDEDGDHDEGAAEEGSDEAEGGEDDDDDDDDVEAQS